VELSFDDVWAAARRRWWVAVVCCVLAVAAAYGITNQQAPKYSAQVTMQVYPIQPAGAIDYNALLFAERLAQTYQRLITIRPVLESVIDELDLPYSVDELKGNVSAQVQSDSELLLVSVSDGDPDLAASIANAIANHFSTYMSAQSATVGSVAVEELQSRVTSLSDRINDIEDQILTLASSPNSSDPMVQGQIAFLQGTLADLQPVRDQLALALEASSNGGVTVDARIAVLEPAVPPVSPYSPRLPLNLALGVVVGAMLGAAIIVGLAYLDRSVTSTTDFLELDNLQLLASLGVVPRLGGGRKQLFVLDQPTGEAAEAIRLLRANIEFASAEREIATLAISSAESEEGKTTVAANLAVTLAQAGFVTALVDADMRRPNLHTIFGVPNVRGLSDMLKSADLPWKRAVVASGIPNLVLLTSGALPKNPSDLLSGDRLGDVLDEMKKSFDVIVVDTAPVLPVSDALLVAAQVDGVVLVAQSGRTRTDDLRQAANMLRRGMVRIVGVAINQERGRPTSGRYTTDDTEDSAVVVYGDDLSSAQPEKGRAPIPFPPVPGLMVRDGAPRTPQVANKPAP
jgi:succinoglycan biosynthesis transport protein ExoP